MSAFPVSVRDVSVYSVRRFPLAARSEHVVEQRDDEERKE